MRGLISTVGYKCMDIRELFYYLIVNIIKSYTVMYIAGGNFYCQNNSVNIASCVCLIGKLLLVVALYKQTTIRVGGADRNGFLLCFLLTFL